MKLVIDIPEEAYKIIMSMAKEYRADTIEDFIVNGVPLDYVLQEEVKTDDIRTKS